MARQLTPEQHRGLATWASVAAERHTWKAQAAQYEAELREQWELKAGAVARELHDSGVSKSRLMQGYGTRDMHTINRILAGAPQPAPQQDPPPPTRYENAPQWSATRESEGFVRITLNNYPNPRTGEPVSVDNYLFSYEVKKTAPNLPRRLALRAADEREAPEGLTVVTTSFEFRDAVAEALGIEV